MNQIYGALVLFLIAVVPFTLLFGLVFLMIRLLIKTTKPSKLLLFSLLFFLVGQVSAGYLWAGLGNSWLESAGLLIFLAPALFIVPFVPVIIFLYSALFLGRTLMIFIQNQQGATYRAIAKSGILQFFLFFFVLIPLFTFLCGYVYDWVVAPLFS